MIKLDTLPPDHKLEIKRLSGGGYSALVMTHPANIIKWCSGVGLTIAELLKEIDDVDFSKVCIEDEKAELIRQFKALRRILGDG